MSTGDMQRETALETLGLAGKPTADELRRAYLRQVRAHSPERDPEAFRRVRDAYELLQGWASPSEALAAPSLGAELTPTESTPIDVGDDEQDCPGEATGDPEDVARALLADFARPAPGTEAEPSPFLALQTFLALLELDRVELARELLDAFGAHTRQLQSEASFGPYLGVRWRFAQELDMVARFDRGLSRALATALNADDLLLARQELLRARSTHGAELARYLRAHAPLSWSRVRVVVAPSVAQRLAHTFRGRGWFPAVWLVFLITLVRLTTPGCGGALPERSEPSARPPPLPSTLSRAFEFALRGREPGSWSSLTSLLDVGDCRSVREEWPLYRAMRALPADRELEEERRRHILRVCSELSALLQEQP